MWYFDFVAMNWAIDKKRLEKEQQAATLREEEKEPEAEPQPQETSPYSELYNPPLYRYIWLLHNVTMVMCPIVAVEFFLMRYVGSSDYFSYVSLFRP
jgi:hypothetical protein